MHVKKLVRSGHSWCVVLPHDYMRALGLVGGEHVTLRTDHKGNILIAPLEAFIESRARAKAASPRQDRRTSPPAAD